MAAGLKADRTGEGGWEKDGPCMLVLQPRCVCRSTLSPPHGPRGETKGRSSMCAT